MATKEELEPRLHARFFQHFNGKIENIRVVAYCRYIFTMRFTIDVDGITYNCKSTYGGDHNSIYKFDPFELGVWTLKDNLLECDPAPRVTKSLRLLLEAEEEEDS